MGKDRSPKRLRITACDESRYFMLMFKRGHFLKQAAGRAEYKLWPIVWGRYATDNDLAKGFS